MGVNEIIHVGTNIKRLRKGKGLTQKSMASLLNIPCSTYSNYENNNREPNKIILNKIAEVLDVSLENLVGIKDRKDELTNRNIYSFNISNNPLELSAIKNLIRLCGFNINFNEIEDEDKTINEYITQEIKNNNIPFVYINKDSVNLTLYSKQFIQLSNKILQLVNFEINELKKSYSQK